MDAAFADRAAYLPAADALVVADLHVGRAATPRVALPIDERSDLVDRLGAAVERFDPGAVVVAGDLLHAFGSVPEGVPGTVAAVEARVADAGADLLIAAGNHDGMLASVTDAPADPSHELADGTVVCHGHREPEAEADRYVVGHEHPAIVVEGRRHPCFLVGRSVYRGADVLVLPAFSRLAAGVPVNDLRADEALSPLLASLDAFRPVVATDDGPLRFPPLGELRPLL